MKKNLDKKTFLAIFLLAVFLINIILLSISINFQFLKRAWIYLPFWCMNRQMCLIT